MSVKTNPELGYTKLMIDCDVALWESELARIKRCNKVEPEYYKNIAYYEGLVDGMKKALANFD